MIYLDWAGTAKPNKEAIREAMEESFEFFANPSSIHSEGRKAKERKEDARANIAKMLGCNKDDLIFTSGASEGIQIVFTSFLNHPFKNQIIISDREHNATREMAGSMKNIGYELKTVSSTKDGFININSLLKEINEKTALISLIYVDNESGAIEPIKEIVTAIKKEHKKPPHIHLDAVQALGKIPINLEELDVDSAVFSAHKIGGAKGVGLLYLKQAITPFLLGGGQERGIRGGTENLAGIISLEKCLEQAFPLIDDRLVKTKDVMNFLIDNLIKIEGVELIPLSRYSLSSIEEPTSDENEEAKDNDKESSIEDRDGEKKRFSPYILSFCNHYLRGDVLVRMMSDLGIEISSLSACSFNSKIKNTSNLAPHQYSENVNRVSISYETTKDELSIFLKMLKEIMGAVV